MSLTCSLKMSEFYGVQNTAQQKNFKFGIKVLFPNHTQSRLEKLNATVRSKPAGGVSIWVFFKYASWIEKVVVTMSVITLEFAFKHMLYLHWPLDSSKQFYCSAVSARFHPDALIHGDQSKIFRKDCTGSTVRTLDLQTIECSDKLSVRSLLIKFHYC